MFWIKREPVAFFGLVWALGGAVYTLGNAFQWWTWTDVQQVAVGGVWTSATAIATFLVRGSVTPTTPPKPPSFHVEEQDQ